MNLTFDTRSRRPQLSQPLLAVLNRGAGGHGAVRSATVKRRGIMRGRHADAGTAVLPALAPLIT